MEIKQQITPTLEIGGTRVTATLQDPVLTLSAWDGEMPTLCIEEGAVVVELEFSDAECLSRFQARIAALRPARSLGLSDRELDARLNDAAGELRAAELPILARAVDEARCRLGLVDGRGA